jgi:hypothetical protein
MKVQKKTNYYNRNIGSQDLRTDSSTKKILNLFLRPPLSKKGFSIVTRRMGRRTAKKRNFTIPFGSTTKP